MVRMDISNTKDAYSKSHQQDEILAVNCLFYRQKLDQRLLWNWQASSKIAEPHKIIVIVAMDSHVLIVNQDTIQSSPEQ